MAQTEGIEAYEQPNFHWLADSSQYLYPVWDAVDIKCYTIVVSKKKRKKNENLRVQLHPNSFLFCDVNPTAVYSRLNKVAKAVSNYQ